MLDSKAQVSNAADVKQIEKAGKRISLERENELVDIRAILDIPGGRRFLWRLLREFKLNQSIFEPNSRIAYNSGRQDAGHFILGEIVEAQPEAFLQMMQERKEKD